MSGPPFTVKALFDYTSEHEDDLNFQIGQVITVTAEEDADWYSGEYVDDSGLKKEGIFPRNFVERYEPTAPPRPTRPTRAKKEPGPVPPPPEPVADTSASKEEPDDEPVHENEPEPAVAREPVLEKDLPPPAPPATAAAPAATETAVPPQKQAEPQQTSAAKAPPPPVSSKPSSFKDRIAAFNKPAAAPIAPFKPGGLSGSNAFIKKPFVPPPPSKDAYVPPPREVPPKVYRREEDTEAVNREPPVSETSQLPPAPEPSQDEDQPKPTSLKERIALLQKQQLEQVSRMAEAAQKKEKPKKPPKKRVETEDASTTLAAAEGADLERTDSLQTPRDEQPTADSEAIEEPRSPQLASPPQPSRELVSDTNDADHSGAGDTEDAEETSTSREDVEERPRSKHAVAADRAGGEEDNNDDEEEDADEENEEEVDPEVKRRMELRERMAKMSGGMGMMGMFGGMPGMYGQAGPKKAKAPQDAGRKSIDESERGVPPAQAPPVPVMALPGMNVPKAEPVSTPKQTEKEESGLASVTQPHSPEEAPDVEDVTQEHEVAPRKSVDRAPPPPPPHERAVPPPPPTESRPPPPPVPGAQPAPPPPAPESRPVPAPSQSLASLSPGSESDDELSIHTRNMSLNEVVSGRTASEAPPPRRSSTYESPRSPTFSEKRFSRGPPPIPTNPPQPSSPPQARPPPPPPPDVLSRQSTADTKHSIVHSPVAVNDDIQDETTEYEADYDTDIAPNAKYKDALKAHDRHDSFDDGGDEASLQSPRHPPENRPPPPLPPTVPQAVPPPPPSQPPKRASMDVPRSAPPPPPPPVKDHVTEEEEEEEPGSDNDEYDPYRYNASRPGLPPAPPPLPPVQTSASKDMHDDLYDASPIQPQAPPPPRPERTAAPPPPPPTTEPQPTARGRPSLDISRSQTTTRRSMDVARPSTDLGFIAVDVDLAESSFWWTQPNIPPPVFQNRKDLVFEVEESTSTKRGGKTTVNKDVYVLFSDYSQTIINARFDAKNPTDVTLEQRHEPPPNKLRQDQLEAAHERYGKRISAAISSIQNTTVGDGTPFGLIQYLLAPLADALAPVGARSYGALVYSNLANASIQQSDEIRAGDIVSFRNARFQGHRGGLHQKYSAEVGKPDHVGVVVDWDGTKKKIHAWEQGRESKKVKTESFKLGDLKSGEVKVWRVMPRTWVGWDDSK